MTIGRVFDTFANDDGDDKTGMAFPLMLLAFRRRQLIGVLEEQHVHHKTGRDASERARHIVRILSKVTKTTERELDRFLDISRRLEAHRNRSVQ